MTVRPSVVTGVYVTLVEIEMALLFAPTVAGNRYANSAMAARFAATVGRNTVASLAEEPASVATVA